MKKLLVILAVLLSSGCATTQLGDLEILNETASGKQAGIVLRSIDSSCKVMTGHPCAQSNINTPQINRTVGEVKQLPHYVQARSVPHLLQQIQHILR